MVRPPTLWSSGPWAGGRPLVRCRPVNSSSHVCKRSYPARQGGTGSSTSVRNIIVIVACHNSFDAPSFDHPQLQRLASITVHAYDDMKCPDARRANALFPKPAIDRFGPTSQPTADGLPAEHVGLGLCTAESVSYLQGIIDLLSEPGALRPDDLVIFSHAHDISWHQDDGSIRDVLARRLTGEPSTHPDAAYLHTPYGQLYCGGSAIFTGWKVAISHLQKEPRDVWNLMFNGTTWEQPTPKTLGIGFDIYPGCGIFFVQGASLLRHAVDEYRKALINAVKMCNDRELVYEYSMWDPRWEGSSSYKVGIRKLAGRLFEGAWHKMLRDEAMHDVPQPPWCPMPYKPFAGNLPLSVSHLSGYFDMSRNHTRALMKEWGHPVREAAQHRVGADANHEQGTSGRAVRLRHHF